MGRLIDSYAEGLIERSEFEPRIAGFRQRIEGWEAQLKAMRDEAGAAIDAVACDRTALRSLPNGSTTACPGSTGSCSAKLIRTLVKRVEIDQDDINVVFRVRWHTPHARSGPAWAKTAFLQGLWEG